MRKKSSFIKILILVSILAVPGFLYYLLQEKGKNRYRPLEIYGPKKVASTFHNKRGKQIPDTIYHQIGDFKLINQFGDSIGLPADTNQITIVNFFYTRCNPICQQVNEQVAKVAESYKDNKLVAFYSITLDPEFDQPQVLAEYSKRYNTISNKWHFLTGDKQKIYSLLKNDFLVNGISESEDLSDTISSPMIILIDPKKSIRGFYDFSTKEHVEKLMDEIKVQIAEELRQVTER